MISLTTGHIFKGFLKGGNSFELSVTGTGTVKTIPLTGEQSVVAFSSIFPSRTFGEYHGDVDFEIYVENGTAEFDNSTIVTESLRLVNAVTGSADIFVKDESGNIIGLVNPVSGEAIELGASGGTGGGNTNLTTTSLLLSDPIVGGLSTAQLDIKSTGSATIKPSIYAVTDTYDDGAGNIDGYDSLFYTRCELPENGAFLTSSLYAGGWQNERYGYVTVSGAAPTGTPYVETALLAEMGYVYTDVPKTYLKLENYGGDVDVTIVATGKAKLTLPADFEIVGIDQTGAAAATFSASNAPAAITPQKWLKVIIGGVDGWIPWFSA